MSLPTTTDIMTLDYAWRAQPFCKVEAKTLNTSSLDYAWRAQPFVGGFPANSGQTVVPSRFFLVF